MDASCLAKPENDHYSGRGQKKVFIDTAWDKFALEFVEPLSELSSDRINTPEKLGGEFKKLNQFSAAVSEANSQQPCLDPLVTMQNFTRYIFKNGTR